MDRAAAAGAIRADAPPGAVMAVLHGIGATSSREQWASEAAAAVDILIDGLKA